MAGNGYWDVTNSDPKEVGKTGPAESQELPYRKNCAVMEFSPICLLMRQGTCAPVFTELDESL